MKNVDRMVGFVTLAIVCGVIVVGTTWVMRAENAFTRTATTLARYVSQRSEQVRLATPRGSLQSRDPVFMNSSGGARQVGYVDRVAQVDGSDDLVDIIWYDKDVSPQTCRFIRHENLGRLGDAVELMFPPAKRQRIQRLLTAAMQQHGDAMVARLMPIMEQSLRESLPTIEVGLRQSLANHRDEIDRLAGRWNDELIQQRLVPLAKNEMVPIVRKHGEPLGQSIGRELWDRASLWSFTWRALYDKSPLPKKDMMKQEWDRFVEEEAIPIFESHAPEIAGAVQRIVIDVAASDEVRRELSAAADAIASDPAARQMLGTVLRESIAENLKLREVWRLAWTSDEARAAIAQSSDALEPTMRMIGDELFGSRQTGIDPGFASLLRNQILQKDRRWIIAVPDDDPAVSLPSKIELAIEPTAFPMSPLVETVEQVERGR